MSNRTIIFLAAILGAATGSTHASADALTHRGDTAVTRNDLAYRGGAHRNYRPGPGFAAGAVVGGALAASQPWYGDNVYGYGYDPGYYGYSPAYTPGYAYGDYGTCTYVGGPKIGNWECR